MYLTGISKISQSVLIFRFGAYFFRVPGAGIHGPVGDDLTSVQNFRVLTATVAGILGCKGDTPRIICDSCSLGRDFDFGFFPTLPRDNTVSVD
jgi:hypothetical protein